MTRSIAILKVIFITGLFSGLLFGISLKTGVDVNPESLVLQAGYMICDAIDDIDPRVSAECKHTLFLTSILVFIAGIAEILVLMGQAGDWRIGAGIYAFGFMIGLFLVLVSV